MSASGEWSWASFDEELKFFKAWRSALSEDNLLYYRWNVKFVFQFLLNRLDLRIELDTWLLENLGDRERIVEALNNPGIEDVIRSTVYEERLSMPNFLRNGVEWLFDILHYRALDQVQRAEVSKLETELMGFLAEPFHHSVQEVREDRTRGIKYEEDLRCKRDHFLWFTRYERIDDTLHLQDPLLRNQAVGRFGEGDRYPSTPNFDPTADPVDEGRFRRRRPRPHRHKHDGNPEMHGSIRKAGDLDSHETTPQNLLERRQRFKALLLRGDPGLRPHKYSYKKEKAFTEHYVSQRRRVQRWVPSMDRFKKPKLNPLTGPPKRVLYYWQSFKGKIPETVRSFPGRFKDFVIRSGRDKYTVDQYGPR